MYCFTHGPNRLGLVVDNNDFIAERGLLQGGHDTFQGVGDIRRLRCSTSPEP